MRLSEKAKASVARRYWDEQRNAWIDGYDQSGHAVFRRSDAGVALVRGHILDQQRSQFILSQLASSDFQTDWGTRGVAASSPRFDPASYASGSVSPAGTAGVATAFWSEHRPVTAFSIWSGLIPSGTLDSMGHMHELLTGDFYHQQIESVPEQTWSSAAFLSSAVQGLLGLEKQGANGLSFSPHLPSAWDWISIRNIKVPGGNVTMTVRRAANGLELDTENSGAPIDLLFSPQVPLGAHITGADFNGRPEEVRTEEHAHDTHATLKLAVPGGSSHCLVRYQGGVSLATNIPAPLLGEPGTAIKITSVVYKAKRLVVEADVSQAATMELRADEKPLQASGAKLKSISPGRYELTVDPLGDPAVTDIPSAPRYRHMEIVVNFAGREGK